ncbi:anthranilate synthase component II [Parasporobacterium paucivorans]|uniref:Aminodeoxychorismate synthase, glutamine amidotransferase subunit n=1 Tax=Parasporobacterium paucivorans DSM 15970 TaxID=1122934 RepID=A0A1M6LJV2_9FIRM|nr:aminodeoxychorismate/anthranilate synthase component II [Parasporobacterium paucivorans]SHJ71486.1 aminodeoxychorismate synthase, glutamine amidotransferase subunit [Parasporobacterium paucivorans DSM 15970]
MYLIIDNYDSFVYNLAAYFRELGQEVVQYKNDIIRPEDIYKIKPRGIIISPGPKSPTKSGMSEEIVREFSDKIPILGVCLGHQVIGHVFGAEIVKGARPMHGKVTKIYHNGRGLFDGIPSPYLVTRYHSLVIDPETLADELQVDAGDENDTIMAVSHRSLPIFGVQFHPEAVLSEYGHEILENYIRICENWWTENE